MVWGLDFTGLITRKFSLVTIIPRESMYPTIRYLGLGNSNYSTGFGQVYEILGTWTPRVRDTGRGYFNKHRVSL